MNLHKPSGSFTIGARDIRDGMYWVRFDLEHKTLNGSEILQMQWIGFDRFLDDDAARRKYIELFSTAGNPN